MQRSLVDVGQRIGLLALDIDATKKPLENLGLLARIAALAQSGELAAKNDMLDGIRHKIGSRVKPEGQNATRAEYGEAICAIGTRFLVHTPEDGAVPLQFNEKTLTSLGRTEHVNAHKLLALSVFLTYPGIPFTISDLDRAGLFYFTPLENHRRQRISTLVNELPSVMRRLLSDKGWYAQNPFKFAGGRTRTYTWAFPTEPLEPAEPVGSVRRASRIIRPKQNKASRADGILPHYDVVPTNLRLDGGRLVEMTAAEEKGDDSNSVNLAPASGPETKSVVPEQEVVADHYGAEIAPLASSEQPSGSREDTQESLDNSPVIVWEKDQFLFQGQASPLHSIEADLIKILYTAAPQSGVTVNQLVSFMRLLHPKLNSPLIRDQIDILNKPYRFPNISKLIDVMEPESPASQEMVALHNSLTRPSLTARDREIILRHFLKARSGK